MARKRYTGEFRQRAVDLYGSTPGATLTAIAVDLGSRAVRYGSGLRSSAPGRRPSAWRQRRRRVGRSCAGRPDRRLEAENATLRAEQVGSFER